RYVTLMNVAAGRQVAPEFVQEAFTPEAIAGAAARLLDDPACARAQAQAQFAALRQLAGAHTPAAEIAADAVEAAIAAPLRRR
ncbi:MAG: hypothetical protein K2P95_09205, partial [Hyphomonadaceae bacterium]|nr:hypothetical protein [Hyphomonadaceae bacterium]